MLTCKLVKFTKDYRLFKCKIFLIKQVQEEERTENIELIINPAERQTKTVSVCKVLKIILRRRIIKTWRKVGILKYAFSAKPPDLFSMQI